MTKYWSSSESGFYDDSVHSVLPDDAVAITDEEWGSLLDLQTSGKEIVDGGDGRPVTRDRVTKAPTVQNVKNEAERRILAICPEWRQRNLTAQAVVLAKKGAANWTTEEQAAWDAGEALWTQIRAIRDASDVIEAMDPIPQDYTADGYWP